MKILAPIQAHSEVEALAQAGADEFFCGFYPASWYERWGRGAWPNRRGPGPANLQHVDEVRAIVEASRALPGAERPVFLTLNAPYHTDEQADLLIAEARGAAAAGIAAFIVTDPGLMCRLREELPETGVFASTVAVATNAEACRFFVDLGCRRVILSRHLSITEIATLAAAAPEVEAEAFVLNDNCWFEEGYCATTHSLPGFGVYCLTPWTYTVLNADGQPLEDPETLARWDFLLDEHRALLRGLGTRGRGGGRTSMPLGPCGLCAIPELLDAGVHSLKVVGREANLFRKIRSVQAVRHVRDHYLATGDRRAAKQQAIEVRGDVEGCAEGYACYYRSARDRSLIPLGGRRARPR